jgi:hypothetical protein
MPAYSLDLRQRVLADCDAGLKTKAVAQKYGVIRIPLSFCAQFGAS